MAKLTHLVVTALKDHVHVVTAVKKLKFSKIHGLNDTGLPEGQAEDYENTHGISMRLDQVIEIDVTDAQLPYFQKHVDAGDIDCIGLPAMPVAPALPAKDIKK